MQTTSPSLTSSLQRHLFSIVVVVALLGTSLSVYSYILSDRAKRARIEAEFDRRADVRNALTREIISFYESGVYVMKNLFLGSKGVSRTEFQQVAADVLSRFPGISALEWVPLVSGADRAAVEEATSIELGRPFQFTEVGPDGSMVRARDRAEHYPILYLEPLAGNERALGFDVQTAATLPFLEKARRSQNLVVSSQFKLVQAQAGIVVIWPVVVPDPVQPEGGTFRGFVQGVYRIDEMLRTTELRSASNSTEMLYIDDTATSPADRILHFRGSDGSAPATADVEKAFRSGLHREYTIDFGGRRWVVLYRPTQAWLDQQTDRHAGWWLAVGLLVTALVVALLTAIARRTSVVQQEVADRTAELTESRRYLSSLLHALPGMAYRCLYKDKLRVMYLSEGVHGLTGYQADDFTSGQIHFRDLIHPQDLAIVRAATRTGLKTRQVVEVEYRIHHRGGSERWILSRGRGVYDQQGELLFFEGLAIDITARKQAESEKLSMERKLLETQKLESLGLLAGGIAHDFNNLLTGIMGHANLARYHPGVDAEIIDHLSKIELGATRAAELCQQMLAYSGRGNFVIEPVNLNRLISETVPLLQGSLHSRARLKLNLSPEQSTVVMADATQLRQIAMNLILNAADSLGATGGEITVTTGLRAFGRDFLGTAHSEHTLLPGEYVFLEVQDTGCGMSPETLSKIFDPFFTTKFTGRGLGLAAVLGIVRGHSGGLQVQSIPACGSTFTLVLPPSQATIRTETEVLTPKPWRRDGTALVIDDEQSVRDVSAALLRTFGLTVLSASNGTDGVELYRKNPQGIDLVLLDLTMPGMDGEETLGCLRAVSADVRVLLISGYSENDRISQMAGDGRLLFLQKPFTRGSLEQKLQDILRDPVRLS